MKTNETMTVENTAKKLKEYRQEVFCPKGLKINLQEESKRELLECATSSFITIFETAERMVAFSKSIKTLNESIAPLEERLAKGETLSKEETERLQKDKATINDLRVRYTVYRNVRNESLKKDFSIFGDIHAQYEFDVKSRDYTYPKTTKALQGFFSKYGLEYDGALRSFIESVALSLEETGARDILQGRFFKTTKEFKFNSKLMKAIIDIAICKNAITFNKISAEAVKMFQDYGDIDETVVVVDEQPTTIKEYTELFEKVGIFMGGMKVKADYEKAFERYTNKMFVYNA